MLPCPAGRPPVSAMGPRRRPGQFRENLPRARSLAGHPPAWPNPLDALARHALRRHRASRLLASIVNRDVLDGKDLFRGAREPCRALALPAGARPEPHGRRCPSPTPASLVTGTAVANDGLGVQPSTPRRLRGACPAVRLDGKIRELPSLGPAAATPDLTAETCQSRLENAMSAYTLVMGTLLLVPWVLVGIMMVGTLLPSLAASKRRLRPMILPANASSKRRPS